MTEEDHWITDCISELTVSLDHQGHGTVTSGPQYNYAAIRFATCPFNIFKTALLIIIYVINLTLIDHRNLKVVVVV